MGHYDGSFMMPVSLHTPLFGVDIRRSGVQCDALLPARRGATAAAVASALAIVVTGREYFDQVKFLTIRLQESMRAGRAAERQLGDQSKMIEQLRYQIQQHVDEKYFLHETLVAERTIAQESIAELNNLREKTDLAKTLCISAMKQSSSVSNRLSPRRSLTMSPSAYKTSVVSFDLFGTDGTNSNSNSNTNSTLRSPVRVFHPYENQVIDLLNKNNNFHRLSHFLRWSMYIAKQGSRKRRQTAARSS